MSTELNSVSERQLLDRGRREGYALAALALSLVSFVNLLGAEKSILAIVLAAFAMSGSSLGAVSIKARVAVAIAALHIVTVGVVIFLLRDKLGELLDLLRQLG